MRKRLVICFLVLIFLVLIENSMAVDCKPTVSWRIDSSFYVGETGKLVATVSSSCEDTIDVKTEVNAERTEGYIKVYKAQSEDETPRPKTHSTSAELVYTYTSIEKGERIKVVYFIQPDELALSGSYVLFENFYIDDKLEQSNEIKITVSKPMRVTYSLPSQLRLNNPTSSYLTINNIGTEIITSLKICLSSSDRIAHFSESCKSWTNLPSRFQDKFNFYITGLTPGTFQDPIKVDTDYTTFTGLYVSDTYSHPSLKITAIKTEVPELSYRVTKTDNTLSFRITNDGNGIAYDCLMRLTSPTNCVLSSSDVSNSTQDDRGNTYSILCSDLMMPIESFGTTLNFNPAEITPPCPIAGSIFYKNSFGEVQETEITSFNLVQTVTTMPKETGIMEKDSTMYIIIIAVVAVVVILVVFKVPKVRDFLFHKSVDEEIPEEESLEEKEDEEKIE